ncbi:MAG: tryptophan 2,3-dioxygenase family protein, partial [Gemmatimonadota bacterium]
MPVTYSNYLKLDQLLDLQQTESQGREHDEMLFIIIHQVYELWFKEVLHELDYLQRSLESNHAPPALNTLKRVLTILKIMVAQIDILETMSPIDFLSFRERLESGSGFQSYQFRMLEYTLGQKRPAALDRYPDEEAVTQGLQARFRQPSLWDSFLAYLAK